ncbi:MAG: hypothetical protein JO041_12880 [Acidobacteria bacterium]|nr:hypothetical protein [Acidobacteriota bacterium]
MLLSHLNDVLWYVEPALNAAIAAFMYRRKLRSRFPLFFAFQIFHAIHASLLIVLLRFGGYRPYFFVYWSVEPFAILLTFANIYELFEAMFRQREGLKDFGTMLFRWSIFVTLLMAVVLATANAGQFERSRFISLVLSLERSIQFMMVGLVTFLLMFSNHLGIQRRHQVFGFVMGWGIISAADLLLYAERARISFPDEVFNLMHLAVYDAMLVMWLAYVLAKAPLEVLPNMLLRSQRWNDALLEEPTLDEQSTLLIGIETLVERALERTQDQEPGLDVVKASGVHGGTEKATQG